MDLEHLLRRAIEIQQIPAPTFGEGARAAWMHRAFLQAELQQVEQDPLANVFARLPGGDRPPVVVSAHLDTVFPMETPLHCQRDGRRVRGPGIGDNAVALAALLELATDLSALDLPGDVWLVANVGEEGLGNLLGMRKVVERFGNQPCAYIVLEGMALGHIYHRGLPVRRLRIATRGPGGHSWIHAGRPSAIHDLIRLGNRLLSLPTASDPRTTLNIGVLRGGVSINTIASGAEMEVDLRSEEAGALEKLAEQVGAIVRREIEAGVEVHLEVIGERPGGGLEPSHPLIQLARQVTEQAGVHPIHLECGSTDASVPLSRGLPAVCLGLTHGGGAHSLEEYIEIEPLVRGYAALQGCIMGAFKLPC